jgi:hypothetical protein
LKTIKILSRFLLLPFAVLAQGLITNVQNRNSTSLIGNWNYILVANKTGCPSFHSNEIKFGFEWIKIESGSKQIINSF